jgi:nicotinic acid mononucleotide adenylyltransferase
VLPQPRPSPARSLARRQAKGPVRLQTPEVERISRRVRRVFASLDDLPYLGEAERADFRYYEELFAESLARIDLKSRDGRLRPLDLREFPQCLRYPGYAARIGIFIGSFDPFQMTHLAMALRFLASDAAEADVIFVVPEGSGDPRKPRKSEYQFRYEVLRRQLVGVFDPLVVPLDLGAEADTIEIVRRLIALHPGAAVRLTHVIGSDTLPLALRFLPDDLEAWGEASERHRVALDFSVFVVRRDARLRLQSLVDAVRRLGVRIVLDRTIIGTPSSSAFRSERAITVVFPTEAILSRLELLFRYGMNKPWSARGGDGAFEPEYEI